MGRRMLPETKSLIKNIYAFSKENHLPINDRWPDGILDNLALTLQVPKKQILNARAWVRREAAIKRKGIITGDEIFTPPSNTISREEKLKNLVEAKDEDLDIIETCRKYKITRSCPNQESYACNLINKLLRELPFGGHALLMGTPTPFCLSESSRNNLLLTDNLSVASTLITECGNKPIDIIIGNGVDEIKAEKKKEMWLKNNTTNRCNVKTKFISRDEYSIYITSFAEAHPQLAKVVFMASGVWKGSKLTFEKYQQYGIDPNFESPSIALTRIYPNLHILAMVMINGNQFAVRYLHNGKNELIIK